MTQYIPFEVPFSEHKFGVLARESRRTVALLSPALATESAARLFADWLTEYRKDDAMEPSVEQQWRVADVIQSMALTLDEAIELASTPEELLVVLRERLAAA